MKRIGSMISLDPMDYMILALLVQRPLTKGSLLDFFGRMTSDRETEEDTGVLARHMLEPRVDALISVDLIRSETAGAQLCVTAAGTERLRHSLLLAFWRVHATTGELAVPIAEPLFMGPDVHGAVPPAGGAAKNWTGLTEDGSPTPL